MMEKTTFFLFSVHFLVIYLVEFSESTVDVRFFENKCPILLKLIQDNKVENYTINCTYSNSNDTKITEATVLEYVCFLVENIVTFVCENSLPITSKQLTLGHDKQTSVCPFDFKHLRKVKNFKYYEVEEELVKSEHCNKVCEDLYEPKAQCVILYKVNKFINDIGSQVTVQGKPQTENVKPNPVPENEYSPAKTEESVKTSLIVNSTVGKMENDTVKETSAIRTSVSEDKVPQTSSPVKEVKLSSITPSLDSKSTSPGYGKSTKDEVFMNPDEVKPPSNDENEDFEPDLDPDDGFGQAQNQVPDMPRLELDEEDKVVPQNNPTFHESSSRSDIYSGQGFFQAEESHFFFYFLMFSSVIIIGYLAFHNKNKILAYALEGTSGRRSRRRPNPARYRKLESNLEEAMTSNVSQSAESSVVY